MINLSFIRNELSGDSIAVFGLGISGLASVEACVKSGIKTLAWDDNETQRDKAKALGADIYDMSQGFPDGVNTLILAPGVPLTHPKPHPVVLAAQKQGIEILSDIELLARATPDVLKIGITGTNGKSTTTALIGHLLKEAGKTVAIGGNLGMAALSLPHLDKNGIYVLELSSYQLDLCPRFKPDVSILLNITPDHLGRHGGMEGYVQAKSKIFGDHTKAFISLDDEYCLNIFENISCKAKTSFSVQGDADLCITGKLPFNIDSFNALKGSHNYQNILAAYGACKDVGLTDTDIENGLNTFPGLEHRQQTVRQIKRIAFVNDSKATNDEATAKALSSFENIFWIVGGFEKSKTYPACQAFLNRVHTAYVIGENTNNICAYLEQNQTPYIQCHTLDTAVTRAYEDASKIPAQTTVLLSPAAASFDQFQSFEKRGDHFISCVKNLPDDTNQDTIKNGA